MYSVRKVKTKSGSVAVQVVQYAGHRSIIFKHIGCGKDEVEIDLLHHKALDWIDKQSGQLTLFPDQGQKVLIVDRADCIGVTRSFAFNFFMSCIDECQLSHLPRLLLDFAIIRLIEPASKLRSVELLQFYFGIKYSQRIYRNIPKLIGLKSEIQRCAYTIAQKKFNEPFYFILYDVTTLYFESFKADDFKSKGYSKDNKSLQPQIVIGLLVTQSGFPLSYEVFAGNTFEGKTMLPIVDNFIAEHPLAKPIIVADAAMLDEERLSELRSRKISYIVGARLANANLKLVKQIHNKLDGNHEAIARFTSKHGDLICDFSIKRFKKELNEFNKHVKKAEELVELQSLKVRAKFIKKVTKERIELNTPLIEKRSLLLGIKGYCTDLSEQQLSNEMIISRYHQLWRVEQSFRMSKFDLQTRPIYHQKHDAIKAHILICFVALMLEKYLELITNMSLRQIRFLVMNITETHIQDRVTNEMFTFRSPTTEILETPLGNLITKWKLLPH